MEGSVTIDAKTGAISANPITLIYAKSSRTDPFGVVKAVVDKGKTPYTIAVEFSAPLEAALIDGNAFKVYKTAAPDVQYAIESVQVDPNNSNIVILTMNGEGLKDIASSEVTVKVEPYTKDEIEYQITDNDHRLITGNAEVILTDKK